MLDIDIVHRDTDLYRTQCAVANEVYLETIDVLPTSYPPTFVSLQDDGQPVGGVGIWHGHESRSFLTETFCTGQGVDLFAFYLSRGDIARVQVAEACCLHLKQDYRASAAPLLFSAVYEYLDAECIRTLLLTQSAALKRTFRMLHTEVHHLCVPDLKDYVCSTDERERWNGRYFQRLKPTCSWIDVPQAVAACRTTPVQERSFITARSQPVWPRYAA